MGWFMNLKLRVKLLSSFVIIALLAGVVGLIGFSNLQSLDNADTKLYENMLIPTNQLGQMSTCLQEMRVNLRDMVYTDSSVKATRYAQNIDELEQQIEDLVTDYRATIISQEDKAALDEYINARQAFSPFVRRVSSLATSGYRERASSVISSSEALAAAKAEHAAIDRLLDLNMEEAKATSTANMRLANRAESAMIIVALIACSLAVVLGMFISKMISNPLTELAGAARKVADGDLTINVSRNSNDEIGVLCSDFQKMILNLRSLVGNVRQASVTLSSSSQELSATSEEVTKGAQQIAETVSQVAVGSQEQSKTMRLTTSHVEQLGKAINDVASGAQSQAQTVDEVVVLVQQIVKAVEESMTLAEDASCSSNHVGDVANSGEKQVVAAINAMERIEQSSEELAQMVKQLGDSSQQIGSIVETIADIAAQTNLLALNAAIEAARAGEHGKGFAVVADEVRKLAERSAKATGEISELISGIQSMTSEAVQAMERGHEEVVDGTKLANEAGDGLKEIQNAVVTIAKEIAQVTNSIKSINESTSGVRNSIEGMSAVTEQTSAAAEEMAASSAEVAEKIEQVAAVSEESAAAAEEVSSTTQEQNASVEELNASAEELASMAQNLEQLVSQFTIDEHTQTISSSRQEDSVDMDWRSAA